MTHSSSLLRNRALSFALLALASCSAPPPLEEGTRDIEQAIVGGTPAALGDWPWQARVSWPDPVSGAPRNCGGSLLSPDWILTAAHCTLKYNTSTQLFEDILSTDYVIALGDLRKDFAEVTEQVRGVDQIVRHPDFGGIENVFNDVALLHLSSSVTMTPQVQSIRPAVSGDEPFQSAVVTGWGRLSPTLTTNSLMQVNVSVVPNASCDSLEVRALNANELCAGAADGSKGACNGDSGGPLVIRRVPSPTWEQVGVVSWGTFGCDTYDVYARVTSHVDWIRRYVLDVATLTTYVLF
jgi:secreted trypsin-like serine protease